MADAHFTVQDPLLHDEPVGQWLARVMQKEQNRVQLAQLEDGLVRFLNDTSALHLRVPPGTALRRRICIEVGTRFRLDHRLEPCPGTTADQLVLVKTPRSTIPRVLLSSVPPAQLLRVTTTPSQTPAAQPDTPKPATFLRRPHSSSGIPGRRQAPASGSASANQATALKRISVEEYELARARIFKGGDSDGNTAGKTLTTNATEVDSDVIPSIIDRSDLERGVLVSGASSTDNMENSKPITARRRGNRSSAGYDRSLGVPSTQPQLNQEGSHGKYRSRGSQQTSGIEERSREYGNGYRSQNGVLSNGQSSFAPKIIDRRSVNTNGGGVGGNLSNGNSGGGGDARNSMNRSQQANQNANSDRDDPDFDRRYDKWALRREPSAQALPLQPQLGMPVFSQFVFPFASHSTAVPMHGPGMSLPGMGVPDASVPRPSQHNPSTGISNSANQFSAGLLHSHRTAGVGGMPSMFSHRHVTPLSAPPGYFPSTGNDASRATQADVVPMASGTGYGLDSPADFPPLSRVRTAEQRP